MMSIKLSSFTFKVGTIVARSSRRALLAMAVCSAIGCLQGEGGNATSAPGHVDAGSDAAGPDGYTDSGNAFERPIYVVFKIHIEPQAGVTQYRQRRDDVEAVRRLAEQYGASLTIHGNGEFWQFAAEEGGEPLVRDWWESGHELGVHMHSVYEEPDGSHSWLQSTPEQQRAESFVQDLYVDHHHYLADLLPDLDIDQATPFNSLDANYVEMMDEHGYQISGGGRHEVSVSWFGHHPFHPWRIGETYLLEDLDSPVLIVHHQPQIGKHGEHGPPGGRVYEDQTVAHLKVQFLQIYLNRLHAERTGEPNDRVWLFGFLTHDNQSPPETQALIGEWLEWLTRHFGEGRQSARGNEIIRFATFGDVRDAYLDWERAHPGVSSFHVDTPTPIDPSDPTRISAETSRASYPGAYWGLAQRLAATEDTVVDYVAEVTAFEADGVACHEVELGPRDGVTRDPRWLLWKETDGAVTIDAESLVGAATVRRWDVVEGTYDEVDAGRLEVGDLPVLIERTDAPLPR